ncbi:MAG: protoporphyrinogen oxidase [Chloroflexi bacterium]|nr:protoporphyrinogen oxidase [Chloroflexota bacterium]
MTIRTSNGRTVTKPNLHVAIIGGGISGLSTAWYLQQAQYRGLGVTYTVLEASNRWGGKVLTEFVQDVAPEPFIIEGGPDSFLALQKPWALQLARELGLEDRLMSTNDDRRTIYVLVNGKLVPMPDGIYLIAPTRIMPFARTALFSPFGKLRMALDFILPKGNPTVDESLGNFIGRRMGREAVDKLAEPLMAGIYNADPYKLSIQATFPRFVEMEQKYGGLILGMLAGNKMRQEMTQEHPAESRKVGMFVTFYQGTEVIIGELVSQLTGDMRLNTAVTGIERIEDDSYDLMLDDGTVLNAHQVVMAVPAYTAAELLEPMTAGAARILNEIRYVDTGTITLAYEAGELNHPLDGFGVVIPISERRNINALTWTSTKFDHRAPEGYQLIRAFVGGSRTPEMVNKPDEEILQIVRNELHEIMDVTAEPIFHRIYRWPQSTPQYDVGHLERVEAIESRLPFGIFLTGSPYRGIGMPDCVKQGKQTADTIIEFMKAESPTL